LRVAFKYRLYPTQEQTEFLRQQLWEACDLYNCALEERRSAWKYCRIRLNYYDQANQLKPMRAEGLIGLANYSCCQDVLRRLDKSFQAFYARCQRGEKAGFPRFKPSRRYDSITFPSYGDGCRLLDNGKLRIQGAGEIKVKLHREVRGTVKTVTLKREIGKWFAVFSVECSAQPLPTRDSEIGIDVGLDSFAALSDGGEVHNPRYLVEQQAQLRRAQRKVARRQKGSNRRGKAVILLAKTQRKVRNQRRNFQHELSCWLIAYFGFIAVEDLNIRGLARGWNARSVHDAGWGSFFAMLAYKAESAGRELVKVDPHGTSQTCTCGASVPKTLRDRWHDCPQCGLSAPRDVVSAQVILQRARMGRSGHNVGAVRPSVFREAVCFS
jgi:putative transposase